MTEGREGKIAIVQNTDVRPVDSSSVNTGHSSESVQRKTFRGRLKEVIWDTFDYTPAERKFISKIDFFILTWAGFSYFSKNLNSNNVSNAYVSGMKEELNVIGNEYQTFTTMWTIGYVISQIPSQMICTRVRLSLWCPSWELFWVVVTFASAAVKTPHQLYICRFFVGLAEGTFYPAVHTVLGGWYTKRELAKRACIFFGSAFVGSMFSGYLQAALYSGMNGVGGLSGWRWLFLFDGVITFPMAIWGYIALPDLPANTRALWLKPHEREMAIDRMRRARKRPNEPITWTGVKRVLSKWHFWVYTAYYTFFICSENIGSYMNLWLKSLNKFALPSFVLKGILGSNKQYLNIQISGHRHKHISNSHKCYNHSYNIVCFFAAMNLAIWDGVPFGLKWASYYLTGFAQGSGPVFLTMVNEECAGDSLERLIILGSTNSVAYAFNAWIPLLSYNTTYAPRFLVGNSITVALIVCAALTLTLALYLQRRDKQRVGKQVNTTSAI
ncbi:Pantothenate transporter liz1 [Talaromyces islandicus]|uniref:Pantothenate transporter liz1 n=1 Tax=Talaromyces islandicus TaxID=28573 RepID=A0A0U1LI82_TALIS|nr:Pantothenate transporter liz1 [Talaromyces islandicus]